MPAGKRRRRSLQNKACDVCFSSKTKCDNCFPCGRCFNNSLPCRLRIRGGGDVLASYAQQKPRLPQGLRQDQAEPRGEVDNEEGEEESEEEDLVDDEEDELGEERGKDAAGGEGAAMGTAPGEGAGEEDEDDDDGPPEERALLAMVVERMQTRAMMEAYAQAVVELHRQGGVNAEAARAVLNCWRQLSIMAREDVTVGLADVVEKALQLGSVDLSEAPPLGDVVPLAVRDQRQAAVLARWAALAPRIRASAAFRRHEGGGQVGVLMSIFDDEEETGWTMRVVQASNAAYDRILASPQQTLQASLRKRCLPAFTIASFIAPSDRGLWFTSQAEALFTKPQDRVVASDFIKVFDRRGEMRLLLLRISTSLRTAADVGLKQEGEPGAGNLTFVQCVSLEPVPPSRYINDRPSSALHSRTKLFRRFESDETATTTATGSTAPALSLSSSGYSYIPPTAPLLRPASMAAALAGGSRSRGADKEAGGAGQQRRPSVPPLAMPAVPLRAANGNGEPPASPTRNAAMFHPATEYQRRLQEKRGEVVDSPVEPWRERRVDSTVGGSLPPWIGERRRRAMEAAAAAENPHGEGGADGGRGGADGQHLSALGSVAAAAAAGKIAWGAVGQSSHPPQQQWPPLSPGLWTPPQQQQQQPGTPTSALLAAVYTIAPGLVTPGPVLPPPLPLHPTHNPPLPPPPPSATAPLTAFWPQLQPQQQQLFPALSTPLRLEPQTAAAVMLQGWSPPPPAPAILAGAPAVVADHVATIPPPKKTWRQSPPASTGAAGGAGLGGGGGGEGRETMMRREEVMDGVVGLLSLSTRSK